MADEPPPLVSAPPPAEAPVPETPGQQRFRTCRWREQEPPADHCTHRDVQPFAGKVGFKPDAWCPDCGLYKLRRTPKRRERDDYSIR